MRAPLAVLVSVSLLCLVALPAGADVASPWGINTHVPDDRTLDLVRDAGLGWIRVDMNWLELEPARDQYNWGFMDHVVDAARARGLAVYATLAYSPAWANGTGNHADPAQDPADWSDFVYDAVRHFRGRVSHWGMWNEPNLEQFFTGVAWQYREWILKPGYQAAKAADPGAVVLGPELAHLSGWWDYMEEAVAAGGADHIDILTHHCYGDDGADVFHSLDRRTVAPWENPPLRNVLDDLGLAGKPVWLTETGWHTADVSEPTQADHYHALFWGVRERSWIAKVFPYEIRDDPTPGVPPWGIVRADYSPKPAWSTVRDFIADPTAPPDGDGGGCGGDPVEPVAPAGGWPLLALGLALGLAALRRR